MPLCLTEGDAGGELEMLDWAGLIVDEALLNGWDSAGWPLNVADHKDITVVYSCSRRLEAFYNVR